jgi:hypothetical protein
VRGVFDRLLASDAAIAEAERTRGYVQMFATAEDMGVTPAEFALYEKATARERATAIGNLDARLMQEVEREPHGDLDRAAHGDAATRSRPSCRRCPSTARWRRCNTARRRTANRFPA